LLISFWVEIGEAGMNLAVEYQAIYFEKRTAVRGGKETLENSRAR
jgi:hypothetical protein